MSPRRLSQKVKTTSVAPNGRAAGIDHHHDVAVGGEELGVPAIAPVVAPVALRAAVDQKFERVLFRRIEARRADEEAFELGAVLGCEPEGFHLGEIEFGEKAVVEVGDRARVNRPGTSGSTLPPRQLASMESWVARRRYITLLGSRTVCFVARIIFPSTSGIRPLNSPSESEVSGVIFPSVLTDDTGSAPHSPATK